MVYHIRQGGVLMYLRRPYKMTWWVTSGPRALSLTPVVYTHLSLPPFQDSINVIVCDLALFGGEHMRGTVPDDGQHFVLP